MVLVLYIICASPRVIGYGFMYPGLGVSLSSLRSGTEWDRILALWVSFCHLMHDGALLSALCLVVMFGKRAVLCFEYLCAEVLRHCETYSCVPSGPVTHATTIKVEHSSFLSQYELVAMFIQVKTAFGIYGKVGGALIFALVLDVATRMFFLACQVLFRHESFVSPFIFAMTTFQAVKKILALLTIAELGHQHRRSPLRNERPSPPEY